MQLHHHKQQSHTLNNGLKSFCWGAGSHMLGSRISACDKPIATLTTLSVAWSLVTMEGDQLGSMSLKSNKGILLEKATSHTRHHLSCYPDSTGYMINHPCTTTSSLAVLQWQTAANAPHTNYRDIHAHQPCACMHP